MLYVYALLAEAPATAPGRGLAGERLRMLHLEDIVVIAGTVTVSPAPSASALRRHDAVVRRVARGADALLPVRFGTAVAGRAALARVLAGRAPALRRALELVRGREQMTLRLFGTPAPVPSSAACDVPAAGGPGARYLAARQAARARRARVPELSPLRPRLAPLVRAERVERHDVAPLLATVYHLVDRGRGAEYLARLDRAARRVQSVRVRASGPWPAYAFAPEPVA